MSDRILAVQFILTPWGDGTNLLMEINRSLQYPIQWIRKVAPDKHLNNLLWTLAFQMNRM